MRLKKILLLMLNLLFLLWSLSLAEAQPQNKQQGKIRIKTNLNNQPIIKEFSVFPSVNVPGEPAIVRWWVEPGPSRSPITNIKIYSFIGKIYEGAEPTGVYVLPEPLTPWPLKIPLTLIAENKLGRSTSKVIPFEIISLDSVKQQLLLQEISTAPSPVVGDKEAFNFNIKINNRTLAKLTDVQIQILQTNDATGRTGTVIARESHLTINPGINQYNLKSIGFNTSYGMRVFVKLIYGTNISKNELKIFPVKVDN